VSLEELPRLSAPDQATRALGNTATEDRGLSWGHSFIYLLFGGTGI
jgi:hypothetical protein